MIVVDPCGSGLRRECPAGGCVGPSIVNQRLRSTCPQFTHARALTPAFLCKGIVKEIQPRLSTFGDTSVPGLLQQSCLPSGPRCARPCDNSRCRHTSCYHNYPMCRRCCDSLRCDSECHAAECWHDYCWHNECCLNQCCNTYQRHAARRPTQEIARGATPRDMLYLTHRSAESRTPKASPAKAGGNNYQKPRSINSLLSTSPTTYHLDLAHSLRYHASRRRRKLRLHQGN
jgi:hypothetical protein